MVAAVGLKISSTKSYYFYASTAVIQYYVDGDSRKVSLSLTTIATKALRWKMAKMRTGRGLKMAAVVVDGKAVRTAEVRMRC